MHIRAIKEPWRCTNKYQPLGQMLVINQRLAKVAALRSFLEKYDLLDGPLLHALVEEVVGTRNVMMGHDHDHQIVHGPSREVDHEVYLAKTQGALVYNTCWFRILMPKCDTSMWLSQSCWLTHRKDKYSHPSTPRWQVSLLPAEPRLHQSPWQFTSQWAPCGRPTLFPYLSLFSSWILFSKWLFWGWRTM